MGEAQKTTRDDTLDWENRRLCPDESCIGIIGPDGRCTECGRRADPIDEPALPDDDAASAVDQAAASSPPEAAVAEAEKTAVPAAPVEDDDWRSRRLCPDESCIGIIGPDGRCTECGRREDDIP
jgi:hypothetical protein